MVFTGSFLDTGQTIARHPLQAATAILSTSPDQARRLRFHAFDILRFRGSNVTRLPLRDRLDRHEAELFEGNRDALDEVDVGDMPITIAAALGEQLPDPQRRFAYNAQPAVFHGQGGTDDEADRDVERYFQTIDREVLARFSRPSGLPLVLAALPEYHAEFRRVSRNPSLQPDGVAKHPGSLTPEQLRAEVWVAQRGFFHES